MSEPLTIEDIYKLFEKTNEKFEESRQEYDRRAAEADRRAAELDRRLAELDKASKRTMRAVDALTTRWGRFVEQLVEPAIVRLLQTRGIDVTQVASRVRSRKQGLAMEIDIVAINGQEMVAVECKSRLSYDDVNNFISKLEQFKLAFPQYNNFQLYGAVAGIEIDEGIDRYAYQKGLFVIKPSGDTVEIINSEQFKPQS
ncbi:MAG: YraN family protein [Crocosphaera sp.]|nr:YraN family protein [Crocosphaera sp.]